MRSTPSHAQSHPRAVSGACALLVLWRAAAGVDALRALAVERIVPALRVSRSCAMISRRAARPRSCGCIMPRLAHRHDAPANCTCIVTRRAPRAHAAGIALAAQLHSSLPARCRSCPSSRTPSRTTRHCAPAACIAWCANAVTAAAPDHFRHLVARYRPRPAAEAYLRLRTLAGRTGTGGLGALWHARRSAARGAR